MPKQQPHGSTQQGPRAVRSWRLLLLVLLVLLPITVALASPELVHLPSAGVAQQETGGHAHHPSDTPICHHAGHHAAVSALITDNREAELSSPADSIAAIPSPAMPQARLATGEDTPLVIPADHLRPALPVYLRTLRLRV